MAGIYIGGRCPLYGTSEEDMVSIMSMRRLCDGLDHRSDGFWRALTEPYDEVGPGRPAGRITAVESPFEFISGKVGRILREHLQDVDGILAGLGIGESSADVNRAVRADRVSVLVCTPGGNPSVKTSTSRGFPPPALVTVYVEFAAMLLKDWSSKARWTLCPGRSRRTSGTWSRKSRRPSPAETCRLSITSCPSPWLPNGIRGSGVDITPAGLVVETAIA